MSDDGLIDTSSRPEPALADQLRIRVRDVWAAVEAEDGDPEAVCRMWDLNRSEVEAALDYYRENREEMEQHRREAEQALEEAAGEE